MSHVYCPECGFQNPESSNYCSRCGALLTTETGQETTMSFDMADDGDEVPAAGLRAVSDQAEAQLVQSGRPSSGEDAVAYSFR